jgi:hypothetical protein
MDDEIVDYTATALCYAGNLPGFSWNFTPYIAFTVNVIIPRLKANSVRDVRELPWQWRAL